MNKSSGALALASEERGSGDLSFSLQSPKIRSLSNSTNTSFQKSSHVGKVRINTELILIMVRMNMYDIRTDCVSHRLLIVSKIHPSSVNNLFV